MCGIFGIIGNNRQNEEDIKKLANFLQEEVETQVEYFITTKNIK